LVGPRTGIGWYTHHLIRGFEALDEEWSASLYLNREIPDSFPANIQPRIIRYPNTVRLRCFWEYMLLPYALRHGKPDIWHSALSLIPPKVSCPTVATIHDVAFLHFPEVLPSVYRRYWTRRVREACNRADCVISVSEATRRDLVELCGADPSKIQVILEAPDPFYRERVSEEEKASIRKRFGLPDRYCLFVGTLEPRKNLSFLLDVYETVLSRKRDCPPLLVAGGKGWLQSDVEGRLKALAPQVLQAGYLNRPELRALYQAALLVLVPSRYEGFGLQAAEALASGAVVLAADNSSLPEVVGEGGVLLSLEERDAWVDKILELSDNESELRRLKQQAEIQSSGFSWEKAARETFGVYRKFVTS
jgi:glycosyltransferase involved in cell wall biosynthesis